jgi:TRAP-type C4-dicarboxylate transport system permease small subunit
MVLVAVMVASMCAQVFWRYVLNDSLIWPEEVSRHAFIWASCLGMSVGVRRGDLIAIDVLWAERPKRVRVFVSIIARLLSIPLLAVFAWEGWVLIGVVAGQRAAATNLPVAWVYLALPISSVLALLFMFEALARDIRELSLFTDGPR